jgi:thioredoxin reductase
MLRAMDCELDTIVVGAGPAGLSAALTLGRARRKVLVLDSGKGRNYAAREMHGVLGFDGVPPAELRQRGEDELARYGIEVRRAAVDDARLVDGGVEVAGERARTLILATGLLDETPDIDGFDAIYGISAHTCPYCDGWEHRDQRIAVYSPHAEAREHLGALLRQWSPHIVVLDDPVRFVHEDGRLTAIERASGELVDADALFFNVAMTPRTELAVALGCQLNEHGYIEADPLTRATSVDRVYAVGNCTNAMLNVPMSVGDGARAAVMINFRLVEEGHVQPAPQEISG